MKDSLITVPKTGYVEETLSFAQMDRDESEKRTFVVFVVGIIKRKGSVVEELAQFGWNEFRNSRPKAVALVELPVFLKKFGDLGGLTVNY
jgi:hypothetical protein